MILLTNKQYDALITELHELRRDVEAGHGALKRQCAETHARISASLQENCEHHAMVLEELDKLNKRMSFNRRPDV